MANPNPTTTLFDATRTAYAGTFDALNSTQSRAIRLTRIWLDEVEAAQQENRRAFDEAWQQARTSQDALLSLTQETFRNLNSFWRWPNLPGFEEFNARLDEIVRKTGGTTAP